MKQCKTAGTSTEDGGVSTDTKEAHDPSDVFTPPTQRRPKIQVRRKEVELVTNVIPLTSYLDDIAKTVHTVNIGSAKAIKSWIQTRTNSLPT